MQASPYEAAIMSSRHPSCTILLMASVCIASLAWAPPAAAKEAPADLPSIRALPLTGEQADTAQKPNAGIVTGSRLLRPDGIGLAPLVVVDRKEFQLSGTVNAETLLNDLPQFYPNLTAFIDNGGDGSVKLDLRGLGSTETLVLVNGRRWIPDNTSEAVDINSIPVPLIGSVEVATGGGSVAYGSGAVAGTVNFKLRNIDGPIAGATLAWTDRKDAGRYENYVGYGTDFASGRGHVSIFGDYLRRRPLSSSQRGFAHFQLTDGPGGTLVPTGSTAVPGGYFESFTDEFFGLGTNYGLIATFPTAGGVSRPFDFGSPANPLGDLFNFAPDNYLMVPEERWFARGEAKYEFSPAARVYADLTYVNDKTVVQIAPTPVFTEVLVDTNAVAPFLSPSDLAQLQFISAFEEFFFGGPPGFVDLGIRYRTTQLGPRRTRQNRDAWNGVVGVTGDLGRLTYDVSYSYARTSLDYRSTGDVNQLAFDDQVANGGCNVFGPNLLSDACIAAISLPLSDDERIRQQVGQATLSGPLFALPSSANPSHFVLGAEWRSLRGAYTPDPNRAISTSSTAAPAKGHYDSEELFAELAVPLIERAGADIAEIDGGARYSHYSLANVHSAWSWYAGAKVSPVPDITLRGTYQRSIRTPHIAELFSGASGFFTFIADPCSDFASDFSEAVRQSCVAAGVPAANVFNFGYFPFLPIGLGGNPGLREEKGDSWNVGVVLKPRAIPRLSASVDYFNLRLKNAINSPSAQGLVDACHFFAQGDAFCQRVTRDPSTGEIVAIDASLMNFGTRKSAGVDAVIDYAIPLHASLTGAGHSSLAWHLVGTWLDKSSFEVVAGGAEPTTFQCVGRFGSFACGDPHPRWKWQSRISWIDGPLTTSVRWRHTGSVRDDNPFTDFVVEHIGVFDLIDLAVEARVNDHFTARLGVNNLFDKRPPILGSNAAFSGGNTYPGTYDILGRDFFVSANMSF
jgi:outer membrane receptor protein involved in Fe transport